MKMIRNLKLAYHSWMGYRKFRRSEMEAAIHHFSRALFCGESPILHFMLALSCNALGRYAESEVHITRFIRLSPSSAFAKLVAAEVCIMLNKAQQAKQLTEEVLTDHPDQEQAVQMMEILDDPIALDRFRISREYEVEGMRLIEVGRFPEAYEVLKKAHELSPDSATIANNLGSVAIRLKEPPAVIRTWFEKACSLDPTNEKFRNNLQFIRRKFPG